MHRGRRQLNVRIRILPKAMILVIDVTVIAAAPLFGPGATAPSLPGTLNAPATIGGTKPTSSAPAETGATAPTTTAANDKPAPPLIPPSILKGKTMEDIVNQWSTDLEAQAKEFQRLAGEVQVWDKVLTDNGRQVGESYATH